MIIKWPHCGIKFNIISKIEEGVYIFCPLCRKLIVDEFDWESIRK